MVLWLPASDLAMFTWLIKLSFFWMPSRDMEPLPSLGVVMMILMEVCVYDIWCLVACPLNVRLYHELLG